MITVPRVILVPTDYEELATAALHEAVMLARAAHAGIVLMHACIVPKRAELESYAQKHIPPDVAYSLRLTTETPAKAIVQAADELSADLIVMGTHSRSAVARVVPGSVALAVQQMTSRPVMTIGRLIQERPIRRVLAGIDFSDASRAAFDEAKMLATLMSGTLGTVHVVRPGSATEDYTATAFDAWLPPMTEADPPMDRLIVHGDPATLLVHLARAGQYDLVVLGGGGRITEWVTRHAHCPVLAVHSSMVPEFAWEGPAPRMDDHLMRSSR